MLEELSSGGIQLFELNMSTVFCFKIYLCVAVKLI